MEKEPYGTMNSALLFYLKLLKDLTAVLFEFNPYDLCVANIVIVGKKMKIYWHVND